MLNLNLNFTSRAPHTLMQQPLTKKQRRKEAARLKWQAPVKCESGHLLGHVLREGLGEEFAEGAIVAEHWNDCFACRRDRLLEEEELVSTETCSSTEGDEGGEPVKRTQTDRVNYWFRESIQTGVTIGGVLHEFVKKDDTVVRYSAFRGNVIEIDNATELLKVAITSELQPAHLIRSLVPPSLSGVVTEVPAQVLYHRYVGLREDLEDVPFIDSFFVNVRFDQCKKDSLVIATGKCLHDSELSFRLATAKEVETALKSFHEK